MFFYRMSGIKFINKGFSMLQVLLALACLGIVVGIVVIVLNPGHQLSEMRNAERKEDVGVILNAVYQYTIDNGGVLPSTITNTVTEICATGKNCNGLIDLSVLTNGQRYLHELPNEPQKKNPEGAGYMISKSQDGRITVEAQFEESDSVISITR